MKVVSGSSNPGLAKGIAKHLGVEVVDVDISVFANGEKRVWVKGSVKGENIILVQSFSTPVDEQIIEFLLLTDALQRMGARHINLVVPWMGYSLQDKVFREGEPIAAKVVADLVSNTYVKRAFLLDLHNSSTPGFFAIPTEHLTASSLFIEYVKKHFKLDEAIVVSPDFGGLKRARSFANALDLPLTNIDKSRDLSSGEIVEMGLHGNVKGKVALIFDDLINSGGTVVSAAEVLKERGAKAVHFLATHGVFANNGHERVENSQVDTVVVSNSIAQPTGTKVQVVDISKLFADELATWMK